MYIEAHVLLLIILCFLSKSTYVSMRIEISIDVRTVLAIAVNIAIRSSMIFSATTHLF